MLLLLPRGAASVRPSGANWSRDSDTEVSFGPGMSGSRAGRGASGRAARTGALSQEEQAEQKSEAEPSGKHHCDFGSSQLRGNANVSIARGEESIPFRMVYGAVRGRRAA